MGVKYGAKLCGCGVNISVAMDRCSKCEITRLTKERQELWSANLHLQKENKQLKAQIADDNDCLTIAYMKGKQDAKEEIKRLKAEVAHWKTNHADMVSRNAVLMHRPDLKERAPLVVVLYEKVEKAESERDRLREAIENAIEKLDTVPPDKIECTANRQTRLMQEALDKTP